jgi:hypothetical protein
MLNFPTVLLTNEKKNAYDFNLILMNKPGS